MQWDFNFVAVLTSIVKWTRTMADVFEMVSPTKYAIGDRALLAANVTTGYCRAFRTESIVEILIQGECHVIASAFLVRSARSSALREGAWPGHQGSC